MADYQRFVSYLYEYQNNIKAKNCGFCRVELRDKNCRLEVHLKLPLYPFTPTLKVYAFVPSNEKLYGIFLGNASYQQGNISGTFSFTEHNIKNSSYNFSQLGGIFIQTDTGICFASAWKDIIIQPEKFIFYESNSSNNAVHTKESKLESSLPISNTQIALDKPQTESDQSTITNLSSISNETENLSYTTVSDTDETRISEFSEEEYPKQEPEITIKQENTEEIKKEISQGKILLAASMDTSCNATQSNPTNLLENILKSYPQCHPFYDEEIHSCVQLSINDVQKLSSIGYPICNNPFFRHNCQSFQHFIIGRKCCDSSTTKAHYILAVPGIYNSKEQYMASMFGFPHFKCSQNSRYRNNCWGYWYRIIPEPWNDCNF